MSTKMSSDMVVNRSTTRVHAPPGGQSTISFGDASTTTPPPMSTTAPIPTPVVAAVDTNVAIAEQKLSTLTIVPETRVIPPNVEGSVKIIVVSGKCESDIVNSIIKALAIEGITSPTLLKVNDAALMPYTAQKLGGVVIAACVQSSSSSSAKISLEGALLQTGVSSGTYIVPAIIEASSLLEAKVLLQEKAKVWAQSAVTLLNLKAGVLPPAVAYDAPDVPVPVVITADTLHVETLLDDFRASLKQHGAVGIFGLGRKFRIADDDGSGTIAYPEFSKLVSEHAMHWTTPQIACVFDYFDVDKSGTITFNEFLRGVRGPLNDRRRQFVLRAFQILDADKSGVIECSDIEAKYSAAKHPDVLSGKKTAHEVLAEFLQTFDSPSNKDGKVTVDEFCEHYALVSASIDEDDYFELMMRNAWHLSGGEGWCENSSCRRVLVTHTDGRQTVEEIKDDLGISETDTAAMLANLASQGILDVSSIELKGSTSEAVAVAAEKVAERAPAGSARREEVSSFDTVRPQTAPATIPPRAKRVGGGESSIVFG